MSMTSSVTWRGGYWAWVCSYSSLADCSLTMGDLLRLRFRLRWRRRRRRLRCGRCLASRAVFGVFEPVAVANVANKRHKHAFSLLHREAEANWKLGACKRMVQLQFFTCESSYCFQCVLAIAILSVCPYDCPSDTRVNLSKMVQARTTKSSPSTAWSFSINTKRHP